MRSFQFSSSFFIKNRRELIERIDSNSLILIQSAAEMVRNSDNLYSWRQDSNFFYFTGLKYADCALLLFKDRGGKVEEILFIPGIDPEKEKWNGKMLTKEGAERISGIKTVQYIDAFPSSLFRHQKWREYLYCEVNDIYPNQPLTAQHLFLEELARRLPGLCLKKLHFLTAPIRLRKKPEEIECLRNSLQIIGKALNRVMTTLKPGMMEYQVEAELLYCYLSGGCERQGFDAIVAGGANAVTLHYTKNDSSLLDGSLLLIDTGGEYGMYSGDITRVFPVNGKFTERQKRCYQAVLEVHDLFIDEIKPGRSWNQLYAKAGEITGEVYHKYGFISDPSDHLKVSYHRIGHYLGLDVHDGGQLDWQMEPGSVITVEPGLYLQEEGIGIRIEDDILITESGVEVLSQSIPREIDEIESIMAGA